MRGGIFFLILRAKDFRPLCIHQYFKGLAGTKTLFENSSEHFHLRIFRPREIDTLSRHDRFNLAGWHPLRTRADAASSTTASAYL